MTVTTTPATQALDEYVANINARTNREDDRVWRSVFTTVYPDYYVSGEIGKVLLHVNRAWLENLFTSEPARRALADGWVEKLNSDKRTAPDAQWSWAYTDYASVESYAVVEGPDDPVLLINRAWLESEVPDTRPYLSDYLPAIVPAANDYACVGLTA